MCRQVTNTFTNCDPTNSGDIPTAPAVLGNYVTGFAISNVGVITGTSTATLSDTTPLTILLTPAYTAGDGQITWTETGSICDDLRGIPVGKGDC